jgi:hypothetical protein
VLEARWSPEWTQTLFVDPAEFGKISSLVPNIMLEQNHFQEWVMEELSNAFKMRKKYGRWDESHCSLCVTLYSQSADWGRKCLVVDIASARYNTLPYLFVVI